MRDTPLPTNVLIVGGDPTAMERVRDEVLTLCPLWNVPLAETASEAMEKLEVDDTIDAVVVQQHLPDGEGTAFLEAVRSSYPRIARILTAERHVADSTRLGLLAHQVLEAPLDGSKLAGSIEINVGLQQRITDPALHKLLGQIDVLPSPPHSVLELNAALARPDVEIAEVAAIVESNVAVTAKLLQLVNSAFFGLGTQITHVGQAITYLGLPTVRDLVNSLELLASFGSDEPELVGAVEEHHNHSMAVADIAQSLLPGRHSAHDAYVAGMMHDVGLLALLSCSPSHYLALREEALHSGRTLEECELDVIGSTHATIGAYILGLWSLPNWLVEAVARSHDAEVLPNWSLDVTSAVYIAEQVANVCGVSPSWEGGEMPSPEYLHALELDDAVREIAQRQGLLSAE